MNFATECLEHLTLFLATCEKNRFRADKRAGMALMADLASATKFLLPPPNALNVTVTPEAMKFLRLPYPICAFEYVCPMARESGLKNLTDVSTSKSTKRIALAYDCTKDVGPVRMLKRAGRIPEDATGILVFSLYYLDSLNLWLPSLAGGYIDGEVASEDGPVYIDNYTMQTKIELHPIFIENIMVGFGHVDSEQAAQAMLNDVADEVSNAVRACLMLNTKNLKVVKVTEAPTKLNSKRAKKGKPPFFEYHTLDIFVSATGHRVDRKRVDYGRVQREFANVHLNRKWGTVIGHFKLRATGMFWWNAHQRGSREKGLVQKDYRVKPDKE